MRLATICARAGSKRLPGKALRKINGTPLVAYTARQAVLCGLFDLVVVSSDDMAILEAAKVAGAGLHIHRAKELATDEAGKVPAIRHALRMAENHVEGVFHTIVDLDVTAPLRTLDDIHGFCEQLDRIDSGGLVSVTKARHSAYFNQVELNSQGYAKVVKKLGSLEFYTGQSAPETYDMNASMTGWTRNYLLNVCGDHPVGPMTQIYEMPPERSFDIDMQLDWDIVEFLMSKQHEKAAA